MKLLSKKAIKNFLLQYYDNDKRITDELLFKGKQITLECYALLNQASKAIDESYDNVLDKIGYHCYIHKKVPISENEIRWSDEERAEKAQRICERMFKSDLEIVKNKLDELCGDDECYFISDGVAGGRDDGDPMENWHTGWRKEYSDCIVDIWIFSDNAASFEFLESNNARLTVAFGL